ncbi:hypothetical protein [Paraburkholderia sp. BL17N1]|uniref:hypothetical protein n=1 Tax=Paraburkholderia sp. BL17N1 TaxID=1938798 RepID=UPI0011C46222|nr:hypothetical protein [Paraburkholderia sp. BL17N1]
MEDRERINALQGIAGNYDSVRFSISSAISVLSIAKIEAIRSQNPVRRRMQAQSGKSIQGHVIAAGWLAAARGVGFLGNAGKTYAYVASSDTRRQASMCRPGRPARTLSVLFSTACGLFGSP